MFGKRLSTITNYLFVVINQVNSWAGWLSFTLIIALTAIIGVDILVRNALSFSIGPVLEVGKIMVVLMVMLGAGWLLKREGHITVELVTERVSLRLRSILICVTSVISAVYCGVVAWLLWGIFEISFTGGTRTESGGILVWPVVLAVIVGFLLFTLQFIARANQYFHAIQNSEETIAND